LISMHHTAAVIAAMEIIRKLIAYSLARPTRETLFAVLTKDEKYIAKLFIDTVIQRAGDTAAALMFQIIVPALGFGAGTLAVFAIPVCFAMALVGYTLGAMQHNLSQQSGTTNKNDSDSDFDR
jgi:ATP:ADP antiporter, AAA family